jgi:glycosyltransferase involved in cell wall biosynthesis
MSQETIEKEIKKQNPDHNRILDEVIGRMNSNNFKIYYYCPPMNIASGGVSVIFRQVNILKENGFNSCIVYEPRIDNKASYEESQKQKKQVNVFEKFDTSWLGKEADNIDLVILGEGDIKFNDGTTQKGTQLVVNPEDFVIIPEGFPNVMEKFSQIACKKIVLAQSWYYILNAMQIGQKWQQFGIQDVMSISNGISEYIKAIMPGLNVKNCTQSIDTELFKRYSLTEKFPKIAFMPGRSQDAVIKTYNVIKTFYSFFPQFRWIRFDELKGLSKEEFAERLGSSSICLYTDEIAGFGTMPLEAMACGTHVVGWTPLGGKEYMNADNGFWAHNGDIFQLAELLGVAVEKMLTGQLDSEEVLKQYDITLEKYTKETEKNSLLKNINEYKNERIQELQKLKQ